MPVAELCRVSPAKLNLFLYVTGRRPDGYHELYSLMVPVGLNDSIEIDFHGKGIEVVCDHPMVPEDETNLAWRAARLFLDACQTEQICLPFGGISIRIEKNIPVGGGLGGGSSNAAAVLSGLNDGAGRLFSSLRLRQMGLGLGADVPFFLFGGPALARGVGERLEACRDLPDGWGVICSPGLSASTIDVFKKLEFGLTFKPVYIMNTGSNALTFGNGFDGREELHNDLEGPACSLYPEIGSTKQEMMLLLKRNLYMSGSGSSLFALYSDRKTAEQGFAKLGRAWSGNGKRLFLTRIGQPKSLS